MTVLELNRTGDYDDAGVQLEIDDLTYRYDDGKYPNRLLAVTDDTLKPSGFNDGNTDGNDYSYDSYGNMEADRNKGIGRITYNHLNLPVEITFDGGTTRKIQYLYDATGARLAKTVHDDTDIKTTDYLKGMQYLDGILQFIPTAEGYVKNTYDNGNIYSYAYNYKDHLGNVRLTYGYDADKEELRVMEENNYYPFGLKHMNYNMDVKTYEYEYGSLGIYPMDLATPGKYNYKYNGKEFQDELGLKLYDYGARNYDPAIGRWMNIDPLSEVSRRWSPYTYCYDNPIRFVDPDGMMASDPGDFYDRKGKYLGTDGEKDGKVYLLNDGVRAKSENKDVNWGGTLSEAHSEKLKENSTEVGGLIVLNRTNEGKDFTIGEFKTTGDKPVEGYTVEPGGPATTESGKDKRIPEGVYDLSPHQSQKYPGSYKVSNEEVSKNRAILIHAGNNGANTEGCILPGTNKTATGVSGSKPKLKEVYNFIKENSKDKPVKLIINEKNK